jgi:hypothetical protein
MRPSRIRVFDGLRITTEHLDHLQSAFSSAVEDLREIAGLAIVQHGLGIEVAAGQVTVAPGLAFDRRGNRIACDEPQTVPVSFERIDEERYVCLRYQQVEDGIVEGQPTLIFDSCEVVLQPAVPADEDNLVAIGRLVNTAEGIEVRPAGEPASAPVVPAPGPAQAGERLRAQQGIVRLTGPAFELVLEALPRSLGEQDIALDFAPASVSAHVLVLATVAVSGAGSEPAAGDGAAETPAVTLPASIRSECRADGEAVLDESGVSQFSVSSVPTAELSEGDMARLFVDMPSSSGLDALRSAYLAVRLRRSAAGTVSVACSLEWSGALAEESIQLVRDLKPSLSWQTLFAWKALGASAGQ